MIHFHRYKLTRPDKYSEFMLPEHLRPGANEGYSQSMIQGLVKSILNGSFDDEAEDKWLNKIHYELIPAADKPLFKSRHLGNASTSMTARKGDRTAKDKVYHDSIHSVSDIDPVMTANLEMSSIQKDPLQAGSFITSGMQEFDISRLPEPEMGKNKSQGVAYKASRECSPSGNLDDTQAAEYTIDRSYEEAPRLPKGFSTEFENALLSDDWIEVSYYM